MRLEKKQIADLETLGKIHDIGKISIDINILNKPSSLTPDEYETVKRHAETGYHIIGVSTELSYLANDVLAHHEKWDGTGYPSGVKGKDIPLLARILCVADAFDAMISEKPYHKAHTLEYAIGELKRCAGSQFDPEVVEEFIKTI